jgi:hypothetical protein
MQSRVSCALTLKGLVLTEAQIVALEKANKESRGEFESEHPGY